jgi:hypothetical protein
MVFRCSGVPVFRFHGVHGGHAQPRTPPYRRLTPNPSKHNDYIAPLSKHVVKVLFRGETVETWYINGRCRFYVRISNSQWGVEVCRIPGTVVDGIFHPGLVEDSRFGIQGRQTHKTRANVHLVDVHRGCRGSCVGWRRRAE